VISAGASTLPAAHPAPLTPTVIGRARLRGVTPEMQDEVPGPTGEAPAAVPTPAPAGEGEGQE